MTLFALKTKQGSFEEGLSRETTQQLNQLAQISCETLTRTIWLEYFMLSLLSGIFRIPRVKFLLVDFDSANGKYFGVLFTLAAAWECTKQI